MEAEERGAIYKGPSGIGRKSKWLTAEDLVEGKDVTTTIECTELWPEITFDQGRKELDNVVVKFAGKKRMLVMNRTNTKTLNSMFGNQCGDWWGKQVTLYVSETNSRGGEVVKCVRIRKKGARVATAAEDFLHDKDEPQPSGPGSGDAAEPPEGDSALFPPATH